MHAHVQGALLLPWALSKVSKTMLLAPFKGATRMGLEACLYENRSAEGGDKASERKVDEKLKNVAARAVAVVRSAREERSGF